MSQAPLTSDRQGNAPGVVQIFRDAAFDPETVQSLCTAYDLASSSLHDGQRRPAIVNEVIARRIISMAEKGERGPHVMAEGALRALGFKDLI